MRNTHVPVGFWRAVNHTQNAFFRECFVDEMAHAAGQDPYRYRRKLLAGEKGRRDLGVLDAAAAKAGWDRPPPEGVFRGIAVMNSYGSHCAHVVEIAMRDGEARVRRVVSAIDPGYAVNPATIETQTESCVVYALTAALYGEITIKDGAVGLAKTDNSLHQKCQAGTVYVIGACLDQAPQAPGVGVTWVNASNACAGRAGARMASAAELASFLEGGFGTMSTFTWALEATGAGESMFVSNLGAVGVDAQAQTHDYRCAFNPLG